jgi:hypothetical protein
MSVVASRKSPVYRAWRVSLLDKKEEISEYE